MEKKLHYSKYDAGLGFLGAIFLPALFSLIYVVLVTIICSFIGVEYKSVNGSVAYIIPALILSPLCFFLTFIFVTKMGKVNVKYALGFHNKISITNILVCVVISVICVFGIMHFVSLFDGVLSLIGFNGNYNMPLPLNNIWWLILNIILVALFPAVCEELVFRGIILNGLRDKGNIFAVFASAGLFMLVHCSVEQTIYPFVVGCVLGFVMLKTNNLI